MAQGNHSINATLAAWGQFKERASISCPVNASTTNAQIPNVSPQKKA
jgi:hypothetical protein